MILVHRIRLVPTPEQETYFARACGTARFAYNWGLAEWQRQHASGEKPSAFALMRQLNEIKKQEFPWMGEVASRTSQQALMNLGSAFQNFFRRVKQGGKPGYPKFKKRGIHDSFRADNGPRDAQSHAVDVSGFSVTLPRCGPVKIREELRFAGRVISAVVSREADRWMIAISVETSDRLKPKEDKGAIGVDLGISKLATFSDGSSIPQLKPNRAAHRRLRRLSKSLSRKKKGSANRAKAKAKLARLHLRIADVRKDALHKLTTRLATEYSTVAIEDLNVAGMVKNRHLARSVSDSGFGEFRRQLEYKCAMTGANLVAVDRWFPSSKTCCECGAVHVMPLSKRTMACECGNRKDRDHNAALNILRQALSVKPVESEALALPQGGVKLYSLKQEKATLRKKCSST